MAKEAASGSVTRAAIAWIGLFVLSVGVAAYVGFRMPGLWISTLYAIPLDAGIFRRGGSSALVSLVMWVTDSHYTAVTAVSFSILALVIGVIAYNFVRARWNSQRILILVFLLAPTGGYLFHQVGYLEQALFLLFAASLFLWRRVNPFLAVLPLVIAAWFHEMVVVSFWPVLVWIAFVKGFDRRQVLALLMPLFTSLIFVLLPRPDDSAIQELKDRMNSTLDFPLRPDALQLFQLPLSDLWSEYSVVNGLLEVMPTALLLSSIWLGLLLFKPPGFPHTRRLLVGAWAVSLTPLLLTFAGWDFSRWVFLAFVNFAIVVFILLGSRGEACSTEVLAWVLLPFLLLFGMTLQYFDNLTPRGLSTYEITQNVRHPHFLDLPRQ